MDVTEAVRQTLLRERVKSGDPVLCAVSGGADSVCMLHVLCALRKETGCALVCVHVHHGIRKEAADEDAAFVRELCDRLGVPFVLKTVNVPKLAKETAHAGIEESARKARYAALFEEARATGNPGVRIAVAHTQDDNAETVLYQLFRGTGLRGLAGIRPVNGPVIRPLLHVSRRDIEVYLTERNLSWCTDDTNADVTYARNRIRQEFLPEIEAHINPHAKAHIARAAGDVREALRYLEAQVAEAEQRCGATCTGEVYAGKRAARAFSVKRLTAEDPFLRGELIRQVLAHLQEVAGKGAYYQIGRVHVEAVLGLCESGNGRAHLDLPGNVCAERLHDNLILFLSA